MPNGCMALLPLCTSNPNSYTYYSTWAFFEKDGFKTFATYSSPSSHLQI